MDGVWSNEWWEMERKFRELYKISSIRSGELLSREQRGGEKVVTRAVFFLSFQGSLRNATGAGGKKTSPFWREIVLHCHGTFAIRLRADRRNLDFRVSSFAQRQKVLTQEFQPIKFNPQRTERWFILRLISRVL